MSLRADTGLHRGHTEITQVGCNYKVAVNGRTLVQVPQTVLKFSA